MNWFKQLGVSLILFFVALVIGLSVLFYHVSAVVVHESDQHDKFITMVESIHNIDRCAWVSEVIIKEKVITLRCDNPFSGNRYYHFNTVYQRLGDLDPTEVDFEAAKAAFMVSSGDQELLITLTYHDSKSVYWMTSKQNEWLIDIKSYNILWKVDKHYD